MAQVLVVELQDAPGYMAMRKEKFWCSTCKRMHQAKPCPSVKKVISHDWAEQYYNDDKKTENPTGWECPRCDKIHAPQVASCDCSSISIPFTVDKMVLEIQSDKDLEAARSYLEGLGCPVTIEIHPKKCGEDAFRGAKDA